MKKTELLVPVGNKDCLLAAIHNGADAVYLGGKKFGARAFANNFTNEEIVEAIRICHLYGVKIYVTVNTMIYNEEIEESLKYLNFLYENNVDAVIMQDLGLINLTRKEIPNLEIHVSTQAHNHNNPGISYYKDIGCKRVVFDRESSLEEINNINIPIEKEIFVYGALCICYSGNCLFSALNGGRSANRGMCVGSCRLPYKLFKNNEIKDEGYLLSTKDLNTLNYLKEILDSKIDSLKIEGRMKSKEYVAVVTRTYRRLIDAYYNNKDMTLTKEELKNLLVTYNREYTKGYLFKADNIINSKTSNHQGILIGQVIKVNNKKITIKLEEDIHQYDAIRFDKVNEGTYVNSLYNSKGLLVSSISKNNICEIDNKTNLKEKDLLGSKVLKTISFLLNKELNNINEKKINIEMNFKAHLNTNIELIIKDEVNSIKIKGIKPEMAKNSPIDKNSIIKQLSKLGNTPFTISKLNIEIDNNIFINIKDLNELRRTAINKLIEIRKGFPKKNNIHIPKIIPCPNNKTKISILVRNEEQLNIAINNNIDIIYTPNENLYNKYKNKCNIYLRLERVNKKYKEYHNERLLCTELGSIINYKNNNIIHSDYYLNSINDYTIDSLSKLNVSSITLSIEANLNTLKNIMYKNKSEIIVYGTIECMIIKNNIFNIKDELCYLKDYLNQKYLVQYTNGYTHIFNHEPINLLNNLTNLKGFGTYRIELLDEDSKKTQSIINKLKDML